MIVDTICHFFNKNNMVVDIIGCFVVVVYSVTVTVWKTSLRKEAVWSREAIMKELE